MAENARRHEPRRDEGAGKPRRDPFSLEAYLDREHERLANGPTVAEVLARADRHRSGGVPRKIIAETIRADREERAG